MARRRMIDPNFWQSEDVSKLTIRQRLLFIGLFSNADDEGKMRGNPAFVRSAVFPYEDFSLSEIEDDLNKIELINSIQQYEVEGSKYIRLINWKKFQRVDKPQPSVIPDPEQSDSENDSENDSFLKERKGKEVKREEKRKEGKGTGIPDTDSNPHRDRIHKLINDCNIEQYSIYELDIIYSYIGRVEIEVIEAAIKKGSNKQHINYAIKTLEGMIKDGITNAEHLPKGGQAYNGIKESFRQGNPSFDDKPITGGKSGVLPSKWYNPATDGELPLPKVSG